MPIDRQAAEALIQDQIVNTIFEDVPKQSAVLSLMRKLPNMTSKQTRIPVLDALPLAYWVNGDTGFKQTTRQAWDNVWLVAAELATIVPIPEAVLDDSSYDIMGEVTPRVNEAMGAVIDGAIVFGVNRPSEWQNDIVTLARQAGNNVAASGGITYDNIMGQDGLISKVEESGYMVDGILASIKTRAGLRGIKDSNNRPIFVPEMQSGTTYTLDGTPITFQQNGAFNATVAQMIAGAWSQAVYAMRQDVTVKILDQGVIQDPNSKEIIYNLAQQDMIALRVVMRLGWALPNPATAVNSDRTNVPFAYIEAATPYTDYSVTFTVKDNDTDPIAGVRVNVNGANKKTAADGTAVFNLRAGTYPVTIKADDYATQSATVTVTNAPVPVAITLQAAQ
ncbi:phage major capsid protein [Ethanoligenens harbinense]|uniref:PEGA domain protein n=1 Tax=Ethanoligenens harbinense (strain DSM 18485 / JCM 12961 / CGMCC 1.5033 / YUAN-3) TaxID=663278 RepID=E6U605_ETHHY|nr:phage major capsid protein [Ethanoligenens harbinense]ADU25684.1 PEGA domain protein [Ethanoligenens harbinense YUAN-3]AVQ94859.1 phage major capsid protein [Ethanoligenens harbinense YUAN-3]AYF37550.1 phage major capsid protein [Ethanoligenens harbinense]AYF40270.1 phage major capsid protein [Ethanoligenens harbinense]QCN91105.1 phage major capsid protein [Ethanoligenens harbinense]